VIETTYHSQCPDGVVQEDDGGHHEHGEANDFVELQARDVSQEFGTMHVVFPVPLVMRRLRRRTTTKGGSPGRQRGASAGSRTMIDCETVSSKSPKECRESRANCARRLLQLVMVNECGDWEEMRLLR
jgi:hypothetical protein